MKRFTDILLSFLAILILLPLMIPVIIILKLTGEHYIFYYQTRIGKGGKEFKMIKFSTMLLNSPSIGSGEITLKKDPRVFPFGRFLRKTKIHEIPQSINMLKGDMSVIGPRPLTQKHYNYFTLDQQRIVNQLKPGLSGVGAIVFREEEEIFAKSTLGHEETYKTLLSPHKAALESWYSSNQSFAVDLKLMFLTMWVIIFQHSRLPYKLLKGLPEMSAELKQLASK
jgi:lipopolysaccharide/colanic/teichoic acid biosynthesis glycosyltransferase